MPALAGGLALLAATIVLVAFMVSGGQSQAVAALLRDPLAVLAGRSPGLRPGGALLQTKLRRHDAGGRRSDDVPGERVLSAVRTRPGEPVLLTSGLAPGDVLGTLLPSDVGQSLNPGASAPGSFLLPGTATAGNGGGGFFGGGGTIGSGPGGGGSAGTPPPPTISPPSPAASVPEPAGWLTMLVGFGVVGALLRRFGAPVGARRRDARRTI